MAHPFSWHRDGAGTRSRDGCSTGAVQIRAIRSNFHRVHLRFYFFSSRFKCRQVQQPFGAASMRPRQATTLARTKRLVTLSIMSKAPIDGNHTRLAELGHRVLGGGTISHEEGMWLFDLQGTADVFELMAWANRIREHF